MSTLINATTVSHIADLSAIPVTPAEVEKLTAGFVTTLGVVNQLNAITTTNVPVANQVTNLENVFREDKTDPDRMFSQEEALANAHRTHQGYFVVDQVIGE